MKQKIKISIIIVNFNQTKLTESLLTSLDGFNAKYIQVLVVDNASETNPINRWSKKYPYFKFIRSEINLGFAGGNNLALQYATGDQLFFLNNDTEIELETINLLSRTLINNKTIGIISPTILNLSVKEGRLNTIQYNGCSIITPFTGRTTLPNQNKTYQKPKSSKYHITGYCHGAAMMVPKALIQDVGPLDESYFLYYEELDWCERIRKKGYKIAHLPHAKVWHYESVSTGNESPLKIYYHAKNRLKLISRNFPKNQYFIFLVYFICVASTKFLLLNLFKFRFDLIKAHINGIYAHFNENKKINYFS